jgi:hypothetical protein
LRHDVFDIVSRVYLNFRLAACLAYFHAVQKRAKTKQSLQQDLQDEHDYRMVLVNLENPVILFQLSRKCG